HFLTSQRELKGLSRDDVARQTRIPPTIVAALEDGQADRFPELVFVVHHLRAYAQVLGLSQDDVLNRFHEIPGTLAPTEQSPVALAARGSSDNAARYAQYLFGVQHRLSVALAAPSLFSIYGAPTNLEQALVIGVSQSGKSPDIVSVIEAGKAQGALTVAITNVEGSPLAKAAAHCLPL